MKIAIVRRECGLEYGGAERYCANVALSLSAKGHEITVIGSHSSVKTIGFKCAPLYGRGSILKNLSFFYSVKRVLKQDTYDCIYGLSRIQGADFLRISDPLHKVWIKYGYGKDQIPWWLRRFFPRHACLLYQEKTAIDTAKFIVTNSNLVAEQIMTYYGKKPDEIFTLYNGVDLKRFKPISPDKRTSIRQGLGVKNNTFLILFSGLDYKRKGLLTLLEALSLLRKNFNFHLLVLGAKGKKRILKAINMHKINGRVSFLGYRRDAELYYGAADLMCLPTKYDPFANVCLEAMACGTPVITTWSNGASEITKGLGIEFVVKPSDKFELSAALSKIMGMESKELNHLRQKAHEIATTFSWDNHVENLTNLFVSKKIK